MGSSVEVFDPASLDHVQSHSLGMRDEGSLTWFDRYRDGWIAGFAHYDKNGGVAFKDHSFSSVVTFDAEWRRTGGWLLPRARSSGWRPTPRREARSVPTGGSTCSATTGPRCMSSPADDGADADAHRDHRLEVEGQAFSWAQDGTRTIFAIDRRQHLVRTIELPR